MATGLRLKFEQADLRPQSARVWLNDMEITGGMQGLDVHWGLGKATTADLRIRIDDVEIDAQTLAYLSAYVVPAAWRHIPPAMEVNK